MGGLGLWLEAGSGAPLCLPDCHQLFRTEEPAGGDLTLPIQAGPLLSTEGWRPLFYDAATWQLWQEPGGRFVFVAPRESLPGRQAFVDQDFQDGYLLRESGPVRAHALNRYPLQDLDGMIYANWLARTGDLRMHAAGIDDGGVGYAFVGPSGAGKSTLADCLVSTGTVKPLGEDSVILRRAPNGFLLYGTPWHTNPERCSPGGVPLRKVFLLDRTASPGVRPCAAKVAIPYLLQNSYVPYYNEEGVGLILGNLGLLAERVPFFTLSFRIGADVLSQIRRA